TRLMVWHAMCYVFRREVAAVTITCSDTMTCEQNSVAVSAPEVAASEERISLGAIPKLAWAGAGLFLANVAIGFVMLITPSLDTDPFGREMRAEDAASSKMSPFTEVVDTKA